jgi:hypothetical protein
MRTGGHEGILPRQHPRDDRLHAVKGGPHFAYDFRLELFPALVYERRDQDIDVGVQYERVNWPQLLAHPHIKCVYLLSQLHLSFITASVQLDLVNCRCSPSVNKERTREGFHDGRARSGSWGSIVAPPAIRPSVSILLFPRSRSTMKQELFAYLVRGDGRVGEMPTDELLIALDQLMQANTAQRQSSSSDKAAVYEFLQMLKRAMRTSRDMCQAEPL